jgi:hypothetical protein
VQARIEEKMASSKENSSRASTTSTLEDNHRDKFKEKNQDDDHEISHTEDRMPAVLPTEVEDDDERVKIMRRMSQNAINAMLENPLAGKPREAVIRDAKRFANEHGMGEDEMDFVKGALVAQRPNDFEDIPELSEEDKAALRFEITHKWKQPFTLYYLVGITFNCVAEMSYVQYGRCCPRNGRDCRQRRSNLLRGRIQTSTPRYVTI